MKKDYRHAPKRPINSMVDWRVRSFQAARGRGIIVRASVSKAGCLLRAYWKLTHTHVDSTFVPRCYFTEMELWQIMRMGENMLKKPDPMEMQGSMAHGFDDESFATSYPAVFSYLCDLMYEDGTARRTSTLTIFCDEGCLKGSFNDRDNCRTLFLSARSLMELLDSLEAALGDVRTAWKPYKDDYQGSKPTRKKNH